MDAYVPDVPLTDPKADTFSRWPFAKRVAQTLAARRDPSSMVIGIYGAWGEGKTTVLHFIERELDSSPDTVCVWFNPWLFTDQAQLTASFFNTLAESLDRSLSSTQEKIGDWLRKYGALVAPISVSIAGLVQLSPGKGLEEAGKALSSSELAELRQRIEKVLSEEAKRVVVLMDDIDRLDKDEIHATFKLVKLSADFEHIAYVLAFDPEAVAGALAERYGRGDIQAGRSFLEKIVQVPLHLPAASKMSLQRLCFEGVNEALRGAGIELTEEQAQRFGRHFVAGVEIRLETPRMAKRFGNALAFALPILKGEVDPVDLMLIEGIRIFYPHMYATIRDNASFFLDPGSDVRRQEEEVRHRLAEVALEGLTQDEAACARELLNVLFPRMGDVHYGGSWDQTWAEEKRVASRQYFDRFFSYAVPEGDVSDLELESVLQDAETRSLADVASDLQRLAGDRNAEVLISKLRTMRRHFSPDRSSQVALAIARLGGVLPAPDRFDSWLTPFSQAGMLTNHLVENLPRGQARFELARRIVLEAEPLSFAAECFSWMCSARDKEEQDRTLTTEEEDALGALLAERIASWCEGGNALHSTFPRHVSQLLRFWIHWRSRAETNAYLAQLFGEHPGTAVEFLQCFVSTAWNTESGLARKGDFENDHLKSLSELVDTEVVYRALCQTYGRELEPPAYEEDESAPSGDRIAMQFAYIYHKTREKDSEEGRSAD